MFSFLRLFISPRFYWYTFLTSFFSFFAGLGGVATVNHYLENRKELEGKAEKFVDTVWALGSFGSQLTGLFILVRLAVSPIDKIDNLRKSFKK